MRATSLHMCNLNKALAYNCNVVVKRSHHRVQRSAAQLRTVYFLLVVFLFYYYIYVCVGGGLS